jgi:hypothetical protein
MLDNFIKLCWGGKIIFVVYWYTVNLSCDAQIEVLPLSKQARLTKNNSCIYMYVRKATKFVKNSLDVTS